MLTFIEQRDFGLIIKGAKECGWLDNAYDVSAVVMGEEVMITFTVGNSIQSFMYERTNHWLYKFLHDLAHGAFESLT